MSRLHPYLFATAAALVPAAGTVHAQPSAGVRPPMLPADATRPARSATHPAWVDEPIEPSGRARVATVSEGKADVVLLDGGLYQGFHTGVNCVIQRNEKTVAWLVIVKCETDRSAALITNQLATVTPPMSGDEVRIATMSFK